MIILKQAALVTSDITEVIPLNSENSKTRSADKDFSNNYLTACWDYDFFSIEIKNI